MHTINNQKLSFIRLGRGCKSKTFYMYTVGYEKRGTLLLSISSPIIDQFSKFFHRPTLQTICNNVIIIYPTTLQLRCYATA